MARINGTVKWFSSVKGYGFIQSETIGNEDIFVHFKHIKMDGYKTLKHHQEVTFDLITGDKGLMAENVSEA